MKRAIRSTLFAALLAANSFAYSQEVRNMNTENQDIEIAQRLIDLHFEIWNDPDSRHWPEKFAKAYAKDFYVADYSGMATGHENVGNLIRKVQSEHAGFVFTPDPVSWNHGVGRVTWGYGPAGNPNLVRGEDIFTISDGKLASARVFLVKK